MTDPLKDTVHCCVLLSFSCLHCEAQLSLPQKIPLVCMFFFPCSLQDILICLLLTTKHHFTQTFLPLIYLATEVSTRSH